MCCCLPVIFVLFKSAETRYKSIWASTKDWFRARSRRTSSSLNENPSELRQVAYVINTLPRIPKAALSRLMSFVGQSARSEQQSGWETSNSQKRDSRAELWTIDDYSYHSYLNDRKTGVGKLPDPAYHRF